MEVSIGYWLIGFVVNWLLGYLVTENNNEILGFVWTFYGLVFDFWDLVFGIYQL